MMNRTSDAMKKRFLMVRARLNDGVILDDMTKFFLCCSSCFYNLGAHAFARSIQVEQALL
jgi:hypothetical protein